MYFQTTFKRAQSIQIRNKIKGDLNLIYNFVIFLGGFNQLYSSLKQNIVSEQFGMQIV